jgi:hypothetical protein
VNVLALLKARLAAWRTARAAARDAAERSVLHDPTAERLPGTAMYGVTPRGGNRWMCPECNHVHAPTECSVWSGLQYPACCNTVAGHRLSHSIKLPPGT